MSLMYMESEQGKKCIVKTDLSIGKEMTRILTICNFRAKKHTQEVVLLWMKRLDFITIVMSVCVCV